MPVSNPRRRPRREPDVQDQLTRAREVVKARRTRARERESAMWEPITDFITTVEQLKQAEAARDEQITALRAQIAEVESAHAERCAQLRARQSVAVIALRDFDEPDTGIAELLAVSTREVRRLLAAAKQVDTAESHRDPEHSDVEAIPNTEIPTATTPVSLIRDTGREQDRGGQGFA